MESIEFPPYLDSQSLDALIGFALKEDVGAGDITSLATIPEETQAFGHFLAKETGVIAGLTVASRVFARVDPSVRVSWSVADGAAVRRGDRLGTIAGSARAILTGERLALNWIQRMSGIATATRAMVQAAAPHRADILDTRKTAPGLRILDKWAVLLGGGVNHRVGLYDMILIKDNHIAACGSVEQAIRAANIWRETTGNHSIAIEIEVRTPEELNTVLRTGGVDTILLDNMVDRLDDGTVRTDRLSDAVRKVDGRFRTEASGNVTLETVQAIAATGVDSISSGALTHSVRALDVSLEIELGVRDQAVND